MSYFDEMQKKMTGKTTGKYTGEAVTMSPYFGKLKPGQVVILPDDWDFKTQPLFEKAKKVSKK